MAAVQKAALTGSSGSSGGGWEVAVAVAGRPAGGKAGK